MKKFILFVFSLIIGLAVFCGLNVKADSTITMTDGASVRTTGDYQGLRFLASVDTLEGSTEHGFFLAKGEHSLAEMQTAIEAGANKVGDDKLVKKTAEGSETSFAVTIYNIDNSNYVTDITAVAYVYNGTSYTFDKAVVRNIAEAALKAKTNGETGELLDTVTTYVSTNYYTAYKNNLNKVEISSGQYELNYELLGKEFLKDYNEMFHANLTSFGENNGTSGAFYKDAKSASQGSVDCRLYTFFTNSEMSAKWDWLLTLFKTKINSTWPNHQIDIIRGTEAAGSNWYYGAHLTSLLVGFFTGTYYSTGYGSYNYPTNYSKVYPYVSTYNTTIYKDYSDSTVVASGAAYTLPDIANKDYYDIVGWNDGTSNNLVGSAYTVNAAKTLTATYTPTIYTITYHLDGGENSISNPSTYNVESASITLSDATKDGYSFIGWYKETLFQNQITSIDVLHPENIDLYARFETGSFSEITFDYNWNNEEIFLRFKADVASYGGDSHAANFLTYSEAHDYSNDYLPLKAALDASPEFCSKWSWLFNAIADAHVYAKNEYISGIRNLANGTVNTDSLYTFTQEMKGFYNRTTATCYYNDTHTQYNWATDANNMYEHVYEACKTANNTTSNLAVGATISNTPTTLRSGYSFAGWYTNANCTGDPVTVVPDANTTLYAKWTNN